MNRKREIIVQVKGEGNVGLASFRFNYQHEADVEKTLRMIFPMLMVKGQCIAEQLSFPFELNGVSFQTTK